MSPDRGEQLLKQLAALPEEQQKQVLAFAESLAPASARVPGKTLLKFAGCIGPSDLRQIAQAVEEGCERIDRGEW